jgi:hypothetical protein
MLVSKEIGASKYLRVTTESGAVYTYEGGLCYIQPSVGRDYYFRVEILFAFDADELLKGHVNPRQFLENVPKELPAVGLRLYVSGGKDWRISTKIVKIQIRKDEEDD